MTTRSKILLMVSAVILGVMIGTVATPAAPRRSRITVYPGPKVVAPGIDTMRDNVSPTPGVLDLRVEATIGGSPIGRNYFWYIDVRVPDETVPDSRMRRVFEHDYLADQFPGSPVGSRPQTVKFRDKLPMEPGLYNVLIALKSDDQHMDLEGNVSTGHMVGGTAFWMEVK